jgi:hypothetical protein
MTKTATPEAITDALAEARARTDRLQAQADRIADAEREASREAELKHYRDAHTRRATQYRNERDALKTRLDEACNADPLDPNAIWETFAALKDFDAKCGAMSAHAGRLDYLDPRPPNPNSGAPQGRPAIVSEMYQHLTYARVLDQAIAARADRIRASHQSELQAEAAAEITAAVDKARAAAAAQIG